VDLNQVFSDVARSEEEFDALIDDQSDSLDAASEYSLLGVRRYLVSVVAPDRPGVVASVATYIADSARCSVERATSAVVADHVIFLLIVSRVEPDAAEDQEAGDGALTSFSQAIEADLASLDAVSAGSVQVLSVPPLAARWPRPQSRIVLIHGETPDQPGNLEEVTRLIAYHDVPLLTFATWVEVRGDEHWCVKEIYIGVDPDDAVADVLREELTEKICNRLGGSVRIEKVSRFLPAPPAQPTVPKGNDTIAITVVGYARPGFVNAALGPLGLLKANIIGSSMAILGPCTSLVVVVDAPAGVSQYELQAAVAEAVHESDTRSGAPISARVDSWLLVGRAGNERRWPTAAEYFLWCQSSDKRGVLAAAARLAFERGFNIVHVEVEVDSSPMNDEAPDAKRCLVRLDIAAPVGEAVPVETLAQEFASLSESESWMDSGVGVCTPDSQDASPGTD
jgi:predicted amino acid-binding ACT domain protein